MDKNERILSVKEKTLPFIDVNNNIYWCVINMQVMLLLDVSNNNQYYKIIMTHEIPPTFIPLSDDYDKCMKLHPLHDKNVEAHSSYILPAKDNVCELIKSLLRSKSNCSNRKTWMQELYHLVE